MGRLIDSDNLRAQIEAHEIDTRFTLTDYEYGYNTGLDKAEDEVDLAETVPAISLDWIRTYISNLKAMGVQLSLRDAQAVSVMVDKYMMEHNGNATCGPDACEIGGQK